MLRLCAYYLDTYGFLLSKFLTFTLKREKQIINDINVASIVMWQSYFLHNCCEIHFTLFSRKFTSVVIYAPILGKIMLAKSLLV